MKILSFVPALNIKPTKIGALSMTEAFIAGHPFKEFPAEITLHCALVIENLASENVASVEMNLLNADHKLIDPHVSHVVLDPVGYKPLTIQWTLRFPVSGIYILQVRIRGTESSVQYPFSVGRPGEEIQ